MKTVSFMLCALVYVDDFMLACSDSPTGKHVVESIDNLYEWESGSHECSNSVSIITLPSHRRRDKKSQITPLELSQFSCFG